MKWNMVEEIKSRPTSTEVSNEGLVGGHTGRCWYGEQLSFATLQVNFHLVLYTNQTALLTALPFILGVAVPYASLLTIEFFVLSG